MAENMIHITYPDFYPMVNASCSKQPIQRVTNRCLMPGLSVEIINVLTSYLNLTINATFSTAKIDEYSYVFEEINGGLTDMYALTFDNISSRQEHFEFTIPLYVSQALYAAHQVDHSLKSIFDFFNVYSWDAWLSMLFIFSLFTVFGICVRHAECRLALREDANSLDILWRMVRFQLIQSDGIDYSLKAGRTSLLVFSIFQLCIILGLFQGFILSSVVKHKNPIPFNGLDFPKLLRDGKFYIVTMNTLDWYYQEINTGYKSPFYELREAIAATPYQLVDTRFQVLDLINEDPRAVTILQDDQSLMFMADAFCNIVLIESEIPPGLERLMFRRGSHFTKMFNDAIKANQQRIEGIHRKYSVYRPPSPCKKQSSKPVPLTIQPYYGILILFFIGVLSASMIFGAELLFRFKCNRIKSNRANVNK